MGVLIDRVRALSASPVVVPRIGAVPVAVSRRAVLRSWSVDDCAPCFYCGTQPEKARYQRDHVVPLSRGGMDAGWNIVPCCASCNASKRDSRASDWVRWRLGFRLPDGWTTDEARRHLGAVLAYVRLTEAYHDYLLGEANGVG
jgi:hypothetical protein